MKLSEEFTPLTEDYLRSCGWIKPSAKIYDYKKAGEGNMNFVARVFTTDGNFIIKQSRPYVEKYKQIPAPVERIAVEKTFYEKIRGNTILDGFSPNILGYDENNYTLAMEDLGQGSDFLGLYTGAITITEQEIEKFILYLAELHKTPAQPFPGNASMKALNHEHIFVYPFLEDNGFNLDNIQEGLQLFSMTVKTNKKLKAVISRLGQQYLAVGASLLHGDFYPGSWLKVESGLKIIDPEFAFAGDAEFDLAVMLAHFKMAKLPDRLTQFTTECYAAKNKINRSLLNQYTGVEILRRLIGIAQLPLSLSLDEKRVLINEAGSLLI